MPRPPKSQLVWFLRGSLEWCLFSVVALVLFGAVSYLAFLTFETLERVFAVAALGVATFLALLWFVRRNAFLWMGGATLGGAIAGAVGQNLWPLDYLVPPATFLLYPVSLSFMAFFVSLGQLLWMMRWKCHPGWWSLANASIVVASGIISTWLVTSGGGSCTMEGELDLYGAIGCALGTFLALLAVLLIAAVVSTVAPLSFVFRRAMRQPSQ